MLLPPGPLPSHLPEAMRDVLPASEGRRFVGNCSGADVFRVGEGDEAVYLKTHLDQAVGDAHPLAIESARTAWLAGVIGEDGPLVPRVLAFEQGSPQAGVGTWAYLATTAVPGRPLHDQMADTPLRVARLVGRTLRMLHDVKPADTLEHRRIAAILAEADERLGRGIVGSSLRQVQSERSLKKTLKRLTKRPIDDAERVVTHNDFCLPNVLAGLDDRTGLIDVGGLCLADRHVDLATAIRSLRFNGGRDDAVQVFLREYGQEEVDAKRLDYFADLCEFL
ncbi:MAG: aminoglycoside 3'-phosphotransferase [Planctomycetota bacterium]